MKHIKLLLAAGALLLGVAVAVPATAVLAATPTSTVCETLGSNSDCSDTPDGSVSINSAITTVITLLSFIVGIVAVIMVITAGFKYVTAGGDSNKITSAKNTLIYAIIGVAIAVLAQVIVHFVLEKL